MGQPVTTNPLIIMLINMTVVFIVLISLSFVIRLIHYADPTVKKETPKETPVVTKAPQAEEPAPVVESGISGEVIAVIAAALSAYGCSAGQIKAVRPIDRQGWKQSGRFQGGNTQ